MGRVGMVVFVIVGYVCLSSCLRLSLVVLLEACGLFVVIACGDGEREIRRHI